MNVLLMEDSEYLWNLANSLGINLSSLVEANPHLENHRLVNIGELLIIPAAFENNNSNYLNSSKQVNSNTFFQLEASETQNLISYSKYLNRQSDVITWTVTISGGTAIVELAGIAGIAGISIVLGIAAAAGLMYLTRNANSSLRMNSATNVGVMTPTTPNASISNSNSNTNTNTGIRVLMTEMAKAVKTINSEIAVTLLHIGYLQKGKGPDCLPGSQCWKDNKEHWKKEIRAFLDKAEKLLKRVKGKTQEALRKTIEELRKEANQY